MVELVKRNIVYLDRNENQYGPAPACLEQLSKFDLKRFSDYSRDFLEGIKSPLSKRLSEKYGIKEDSIILGYGAEDLLKQVIHCYVSEGDTIMTPSYSWWYYKKIADEVRGVDVEYPIMEGKDSFYYNLEEMVDIYRKCNPRLVLISSPNNPTGNQLESQELEYLLEIMKDTIVILDQAYYLFCNNDSNIFRLLDTYPNLLVIRTFSKYYALAGMRIGFAMTGLNHDRFSLFSARYLGFNRLSESVAMAALDSEDYYNDTCNRMIADLRMFYNEFNSLHGFKAYKSYANFILVKIPPEIKAGLKQYLSERGMIIKFMDEEKLNSHIRITIGTHEQNLLLMEMIKEYLKQNALL